MMSSESSDQKSSHHSIQERHREKEEKKRESNIVLLTRAKKYYYYYFIITPLTFVSFPCHYFRVLQRNMRLLEAISIIFLSHFICCELINPVDAFAGGGFGTTNSASRRDGGKKSNKKSIKKKGGLLSDELRRNKNEDTKDNKKEDIPKLDRFGLPILTAENFFPPLPNDTTLDYVSENEISNLGVIQNSMKEYIQLNYDLFDDNGIEKKENIDSSRTKPWKLKLLHKCPPVLAIENFFTDEECQSYIDLTKDQDQTKSDVSTSSLSTMKINSATFSTLAFSKRTSTTWYCHYKQVPALLTKAKHLLNDLPLEHMEEAQIVRYRTGEEFSWHYDEIPKEQLVNGGQRIATLLVYLNTLSDEGGGGTIFRDLKGLDGFGQLTIRPKKGSALLFFPAKADGSPDDRTLHKGEVAVEEKMIAQMWIHEGHYSPVVPDGNSHDAAIASIRQKAVELGYATT